MKLSTIQWIVLGAINLICLVALGYSSSPYEENASYHTTSQLLLADHSQLNIEEYLTLGHGRFTQSTLESLNGKVRNATLAAEVTGASRERIQVKISNVKLSQDDELFAIEKTPDLFFRRQYAFQEGAILNYQFLPSANETTLCFHIHELQRLRCLNR